MLHMGMTATKTTMLRQLEHGSNTIKQIPQQPSPISKRLVAIPCKQVNFQQLGKIQKQLINVKN
jgi:2-keto-3-deoxy-6-phosphogluconate aldolase